MKIIVLKELTFFLDSRRYRQPMYGISTAERLEMVKDISKSHEFEPLVSLWTCPGHQLGSYIQCWFWKICFFNLRSWTKTFSRYWITNLQNFQLLIDESTDEMNVWDDYYIVLTLYISTQFLLAILFIHKVEWPLAFTCFSALPSLFEGVGGLCNPFLI